MSTLTVDIVTPEKIVFTGQVDEVRAPGVNGEFGVLPEHALFLTLLRAGVVEVVTGGGRERFIVGRGFAEAGPDRLVILTDSCDAADAIDKEDAQRTLDKAEAVIADSQPDSEERYVAEQKAELARAMLEA